MRSRAKATIKMRSFAVSNRVTEMGNEGSDLIERVASKKALRIGTGYRFPKSIGKQDTPRCAAPLSSDPQASGPGSSQTSRAPTHLRHSGPVCRSERESGSRVFGSHEYPVTLDTYSHLVPSMTQEAADLLATAFEPKASNVVALKVTA